MSAIPIATARAKLPELVDRAQHEAVRLSRHGKPVAVLVSIEAYEQMIEALEDAADIAAYDEAITEDGPDIPWEQVKADLGLI
ncbi:MAG: prevent-host-death family protein [Actinomycetales bacterium]|nr:MAG: prevent-host-death family protein [Actinomycetales bacterium]